MYSSNIVKEVRVMVEGTNDSVTFDAQPKNSPGGILSMLFRKVMKEGNFMPYVNILTDRYLTRTTAQNVSAVKRRTKNTLKTNMTSPEMTFKVFVDLIFFFLGAKKMSISIKLTYPNGEESVHSINVTPNITERQPEDVDEGANKPSD